MKLSLSYIAPVCLILITLTSCKAQTQIAPTATVVPTVAATTPALLVSYPNIVLFRGNAQRTGVYDLHSIRDQPQVKWRTKVGSTWLMPPMLADGRLYAGSGDGVLYALNAKTVEQVWSADGFGPLESTGAIAGDKIITAGFSNLVKALNRHTGDEL